MENYNLPLNAFFLWQVEGICWINVSGLFVNKLRRKATIDIKMYYAIFCQLLIKNT
jgi:hypothetical protein